MRSPSCTKKTSVINDVVSPGHIPRAFHHSLVDRLTACETEGNALKSLSVVAFPSTEISSKCSMKQKHIKDEEHNFSLIM